MTTKYMVNRISHGVVLHRYYIGQNPDEVGTPAFWDEAIKQLYARHPFPGYWDGLGLHIWHMDCPALDEMRSRGEVCLEDFAPNVAGCQVAAGLFHNKSRLEIGVFPPGYSPERQSGQPILERDLIAARTVLSHEAGHFHAHMSGYGDRSTYIRRQITDMFNNLLIKSGLKLGPPGEAWAEIYRAIMGTDETIGTFSDWKRAQIPGELAYLVKSAYWLQGNLAGKIIGQLEISDRFISWEEFRVETRFFISQLVSVGLYGLSDNWELMRWYGQKWQKIA